MGVFIFTMIIKQITDSAAVKEDIHTYAHAYASPNVDLPNHTLSVRLVFMSS